MKKQRQKKEKVNTSIFYITINTQKMMDKKKLDIFDKTLDYIFSKDNLGTYLKNKDGVFDPSKIIEYKYKKNVEVGKKYHKAHAHAILKISHKMKLQVNKKAIEKYYENFLTKGLKYKDGKIYTHFNGKGDDKKNWEEYMFKDTDENEEDEAENEEKLYKQKKNEK